VDSQSKPSSSSISSSVKKTVPTELKKPSPSPSVKRDKAEKLLKEHGSPPGVRVTAGGRIVPADCNLTVPISSSNQSQLHPHRRPHASYSSFKSSDPSLHSTWLNPFSQLPINSYSVNLPDGYVFLAPDGRLHQCVNRISFPLNRNPIDGRPLFIAPPINFPFLAVDPMTGFDNNASDGFTNQSRVHNSSANIVNEADEQGSPQSLSTLSLRQSLDHDSCCLEILALGLDAEGKRSTEHELTLLERIKAHQQEEFRNVEKGIVHADPVTKQALISRKIDLTNCIDRCRKAQKDLGQQRDNGLVYVVPTAITVEAFSADIPNSKPREADEAHANDTSPTQQPEGNANALSRRNRSHAIPIRPPHAPQDAATASSSRLNPASPAFISARPVASRNSQPISPFVPPSPSAPGSPLNLSDEMREQLPPHLQGSSSSVGTSDFFPTATEQYSLKRGQDQGQSVNTGKTVSDSQGPQLTLVSYPSCPYLIRR
jgi:hypothetical protein